MGTTSGKSLILCKSAHQQNTAKVARVTAGVLGADLVTPEEIPQTSLSEYGLAGFGSGAYYGRLHGGLYGWLRGLPDCREPLKPAFVFSTSGLPFLTIAWHAPLKSLLGRKGFEVVGEFSCRGCHRAQARSEKMRICLGSPPVAHRERAVDGLGLLGSGMAPRVFGVCWA